MLHNNLQLLFTALLLTDSTLRFHKGSVKKLKKYKYWI